MRELSLFSGAGGGLLGTHWLLGWECVGYVEWDEYCCKVLEQRIKDGLLPRAPIYQMDIREFNRRVAERYRGVADVVTGGFPCQPFSVAGKQVGADDERNMWPATIECIRLVGPRYALLENVPGLLSCGYVGTVLGELAEAGYSVEWECVPAAAIGAPHFRNRVFFVASTDNVAHADGARLQGVHDASRREYLQSIAGDISEHVWCSTPRVCGRADGLAHRLDRLHAIGNGQVPAVVAAAWRMLGGE
jgi:DNA (cytosine-5)-methyltransferase 1